MNDTYSKNDEFASGEKPIYEFRRKMPDITFLYPALPAAAVVLSIGWVTGASGFAHVALVMILAMVVFATNAHFYFQLFRDRIEFFYSLGYRRVRIPLSTVNGINALSNKPFNNRDESRSLKDRYFSNGFGMFWRIYGGFGSSNDNALVIETASKGAFVICCRDPEEIAVKIREAMAVLECLPEQVSEVDFDPEKPDLRHQENM